MIEVRLFELMVKGDRLDEINAEEVLDRRAAAQASAQARRLYLRPIKTGGKIRRRETALKNY